MRFTCFFPVVNSIEWSKCYPFSLLFAGVITAAVLSSMGALAAILIAVWFIKYKKRAVERDDRGGNGESMTRGGTLGIFGWVCAASTLEPLAYTRASFSWILLPYTRVNSWFP